MSDTGEYFGSAEQISLTQRGQSLWQLMKDNPVYSFYGRMVSLCDPDDNAVYKMLSLASLQVAASCQYYPIDQADKFCSGLEAHGMNASRYEQCRGEKAALDVSRKILSERQLPDDLSVVVLNQRSSTKLVREVAEVSLACGVMPVPGSAMRGISREGVCLAAVDGVTDGDLRPPCILPVPRDTYPKDHLDVTRPIYPCRRRASPRVPPRYTPIALVFWT